MKQYILNDFGYWKLCEVQGSIVLDVRIKTYLMTDGVRYKIGCSISPEARLRVLRIGNLDIKLIASGPCVTEKHLHEVYKDKRIRGEWFSLSESDVKDIIYRLND